MIPYDSYNSKVRSNDVIKEYRRDGTDYFQISVKISSFSESSHQALVVTDVSNVPACHHLHIMGVLIYPLSKLYQVAQLVNLVKSACGPMYPGQGWISYVKLGTSFGILIGMITFPSHKGVDWY